MYFSCIRSIYPEKFKYFFLVLSIYADQTVLLSQLHCTGTHHPASLEDNAQPKSHIPVSILSFKLFNSLLIDNSCSHAKSTDAASFLNLCFSPGDPAAGRPWLLHLRFYLSFLCVVSSFSAAESRAMGQATSVQITRLLLIPHNCFCSFCLKSCYALALLQSLLFKVQHGQRKEPDRRF